MEVLRAVPNVANLESSPEYGDYIPLTAFSFLHLFFCPAVCPIHSWQVSFPQTHVFPPICCLQWPPPTQYLAGTSLLTELRCSLEWGCRWMRGDIHDTYDKVLQNQQGKSKQKYSNIGKRNEQSVLQSRHPKGQKGGKQSVNQKIWGSW